MKDKSPLPSPPLGGFAVTILPCVTTNAASEPGCQDAGPAMHDC